MSHQPSQEVQAEFCGNLISMGLRPRIGVRKLSNENSSRDQKCEEGEEEEVGSSQTVDTEQVEGFDDRAYETDFCQYKNILSIQ